MLSLSKTKIFHNFELYFLDQDDLEAEINLQAVRKLRLEIFGTNENHIVKKNSRKIVTTGVKRVLSRVFSRRGKKPLKTFGKKINSIKNKCV